MDAKIVLHVKCTLFYLLLVTLATPSHTDTKHSLISVGDDEKWNGQHSPYFLFSSFSEQFSYLYGSRDVYDSINWTSNNNNGIEEKFLLSTLPLFLSLSLNPHTWSRKNYFISPQLFVYMFSGIWTSDSHKYTKNVCMTGHNIKYHQNKRNKMEELEDFYPHPFHPSSLHHSTPNIWLVFCVSKYPHISTMSSTENISQKNFHVEREGNCGIKTCWGRRW